MDLTHLPKTILQTLQTEPWQITTPTLADQAKIVAVLNTKRMDKITQQTCQMEVWTCKAVVKEWALTEKDRPLKLMSWDPRSVPLNKAIKWMSQLEVESMLMPAPMVEIKLMPPVWAKKFKEEWTNKEIWPSQSEVESMLRLLPMVRIELTPPSKTLELMFKEACPETESKCRSMEMDTQSKWTIPNYKTVMDRCSNKELSSTNSSNTEWMLPAWKSAQVSHSALTQANVADHNSAKCAVSMSLWPTRELENRTRCSDAWTTSSHQSTLVWPWTMSRSTWNVLMVPRAQPLTWPPLSWLQWSQWSSWLFTEHHEYIFRNWLMLYHKKGELVEPTDIAGGILVGIVGGGIIVGIIAGVVAACSSVSVSASSWWWDSLSSGRSAVII